jgi:hypothetical protein
MCAWLGAGDHWYHELTPVAESVGSGHVMTATLRGVSSSLLGVILRLRPVDGRKAHVVWGETSTSSVTGC